MKKTSKALIVPEKDTIDQRITEWYENLSRELIQIVPSGMLIKMVYDPEFIELFPQLYLSVSEKDYHSGVRWEGKLALWRNHPQILEDEHHRYSSQWDPKIGIVQSVIGWPQQQLPHNVSDFLKYLSKRVYFESRPGCRLYYLESRPLEK